MIDIAALFGSKAKTWSVVQIRARPDGWFEADFLIGKEKYTMPICFDCAVRFGHVLQ